MNLENILKCGYIVIIISFILMVWASLAGAKQEQMHRSPPCAFNPSCTCSKVVPDLGIVRCIDMHLPRVPEILNFSKVFTLHMENNGLRSIEPYFFQSTGLYKLSIKNNLLTCIPDESFVGLERSLWELDLANNELTEVPARALRNLEKLKVLDLSGNDISSLLPKNWRGLEASLEVLILAANSISHLSPDSFTGLPKVETIDLSGNNLREIDPTVFRDGMDKLTNLLLYDNQLSVIPYQALSPLKHLRTLDLGQNIITKILPNSSQEGSQPMNLKFNLDLLKLDYNLIEVLESNSYQNFDVLNRTILDGNQIAEIEMGAFRSAKVKEIYMRNCALKEITPEAFDGVENYLEYLDLSGNNLRTLTADVFRRYEVLRTLFLQNNFIGGYDPKLVFNGLPLYNLDLSGSTNEPVALQDLRRLRTMRHLSVSKLTSMDLSPNDFEEFGMDMENLKINYAGLKTLKNNCFRNVRGIKSLDLSENSLNNIEADAFTDVRHSLSTLKLSHALSDSYDTLPADVFRTLSYLEYLDLSNNKIRNIPDSTFHFLKKLKILELQDNAVEHIRKGTFQGTLHTNLESIYLSFNNIRMVSQHAFVDMESLEQIHLDDNKLEKLESRAFMNLRELNRLNLKGNRLMTVGLEAFQNLPELEDLDMSFNKLSSFDFAMFDQVGTLSYMFSVNMSYNKFTELKRRVEGFGAFGMPLSSVKILDFSHNNISYISKKFFRPAERSLIRLSMSHNEIFKATSDVFGGIVNLQWFDISHNRLLEFEENLFMKSRELQVLDASHNLLGEVPSDLFRYLKKLRIVDLSHNRINMLPDNIFREEGLESLDVSHNQLIRIPLASHSVAAASTLCNLDISWNAVSTVTNRELFSRFKNLNSLDLSHNRLVTMDAGVFGGLSKLAVLNLGHNSEMELAVGGVAFKGIEDTLWYLNLDNISMPTVPDLPLANLNHLSLAHNFLPSIPIEMAASLNSLRKLNLGYNDLTIVPIVVESLINLRSLSLVSNLINSVTNASFLGVADQLEELDLRNLDLQVFEPDALSDMSSLRTLKIGTYNIRKFNIPAIIEDHNALKNLEIHAEKETNLGEEMMGELPAKLWNITLTGRGFKSLNSYILKGLQSPRLHLTLRNTGISRVFSDLFRNAGHARNVSVDVRGNALQYLENPSTGSKPGLNGRTFLVDLWLSSNRWSCDCDIGWVEIWQRKRRQYLCGRSPSILEPSRAKEYRCRHVEDDLRTATCVNKANKSVIETLKVDLECGWSSACGQFGSLNLILILLIISFGLCFV